MTARGRRRNLGGRHALRPTGAGGTDRSVVPGYAAPRQLVDAPGRRTSRHRAWTVLVPPIVLGMGAAALTVAARAPRVTGELAHALGAPTDPPSSTQVLPGEREPVGAPAAQGPPAPRQRLATTTARAPFLETVGTAAAQPRLEADGTPAPPAPSVTPSPAPSAGASPTADPTPTASSTPLGPSLPPLPIPLPTPTVGLL